MLSPWTEIASRFRSEELGHGRLFHEDNGYEVIPHEEAEDNDNQNITYRYYPSQASVFLRDDTLQTPLELALALERSHGVASPAPGTLEALGP